MLELSSRYIAMQYYLDNYINEVGGPNENYAREMMELHTLGAENYVPLATPASISKTKIPLPWGNDGSDVMVPISDQYVDDVVCSAMRMLTGWKVKDHSNRIYTNYEDTGEFFFYEPWHDKFEKTILGNHWGNNELAPGNPPESLNGLATVMSIDNEDTSSFHPNSGRYQEEHLATLEQMYSGSSRLDAAMRGAIDIVNILTGLNLTIPDSCPEEELAQALGLIAQTIKADLGMQIATVDFGGWDTHQNSGNLGTGYYVDRLGVASAAIAAFFADLTNTGKKDRVVLATQTDFGRRVWGNGNRGTDHGTAQAMMVAGGNINGGKVYGTFPGIDDVDLYLNADLAVSTDFRRPLSDIVLNHLGNSKIQTVFPGYSGDINMGLITNKVTPADEVIFSGGFE